jgi:two-component system response regulator HydG
VAKILVIDDEESIVYTFESFLSDEGHDVLIARNYDDALMHLAGPTVDVVFCDIILGGKTGIDVLREVKTRGLMCPVVMITGLPDVRTASEAVRLGAFDYVAKPVVQEMVVRLTNVALQHKRALDDRERWRARLEAIYSSVEDAIITVDKSRVLTEMNEAAKDICGLDRKALGRDITSLDFECAGQCVEMLKTTLDAGQTIRGQRFESRQNGHPPKVLNVSTYPLVERQGSFAGAVMVVREETRIANLERALCQRERLHNILGKSRRMQSLYLLVEALARAESTVLITGESGTGKELIAEALHSLGGRRDQPLVKVNCSALSESLLESELFGHVKGAFTGAVSDRLGRFQRANGGTIFLDEIGDVSPKVQVTILRVLEEKQCERVGDSMPIRLDVRVIAATNKDLQERVRRGEFREDLLYRLRVVEVAVPPLRDRQEDIPLLVEHFLKEFSRKTNKEVAAISSDVESILLDYSWPGNIRELEHALEHAFVLCHNNTITVDHLPLHIREASRTKATWPTRVSSLGASATDKHQVIIRALEKTDWNKAKTARLLGVDRKTLYRQIAKYGILPEPSEESRSFHH